MNTLALNISHATRVHSKAKKRENTVEERWSSFSHEWNPQWQNQLQALLPSITMHLIRMIPNRSISTKMARGFMPSQIRGLLKTSMTHPRQSSECQSRRSSTRSIIKARNIPDMPIVAKAKLVDQSFLLQGMIRLKAPLHAPQTSPVTIQSLQMSFLSPLWAFMVVEKWYPPQAVKRALRVENIPSGSVGLRMWLVVKSWMSSHLVKLHLEPRLSALWQSLSKDNIKVRQATFRKSTTIRPNFCSFLSPQLVAMWISTRSRQQMLSLCSTPMILTFSKWKVWAVKFRKNPITNSPRILENSFQGRRGALMARGTAKPMMNRKAGKMRSAVDIPSHLDSSSGHRGCGPELSTRIIPSMVSPLQASMHLNLCLGFSSCTKRVSLSPGVSCSDSSLSLFIMWYLQPIYSQYCAWIRRWGPCGTIQSSSREFPPLVLTSS